jgi:hypothetical protein
MKRPYTTRQLQQAIYDVQVHGTPSIRGSAADHGIPPSTLRDQLNGRTDARTAQLTRQKLSPDQERWLTEWIIEEHSLWRAPSHAIVKEMANLLARVNGDYKPVGKNWVSAFKDRNTRVTSLIGRTLDKERVNGSDKATLASFYELLRRVVEEHHIKPQNIWNMDEHGIRSGKGSNGRVLGPVSNSGSKRTYVQEAGTSDWVSIIEAANTEGRSTTPLIIFKGGNLHSSWFPLDLEPNWHYTASENGWTSNHIGLQWMKIKFTPETASTDPDEWRLLICDGHGSHASVEFMWMAKNHKIFVLYLPPHTSHLTQPLDLSFFGPLKKNYRRELEMMSHYNDAADIKRSSFLRLYQKARRQVTPAQIKIGFSTAGIYPYNPKKVLESSQLPSNRKPVLPPSTPSPPQKRKRSPVAQTPSRPQDIPSLLTSINGVQGDRAARKVCKVLMKGFAAQSTERAAQAAEITKLKAQLEELKPTTRKKVKIDLNESFASLNDIKEAQERERLELRRRERRRARGMTKRSTRGRGGARTASQSGGLLGRVTNYFNFQF